LKICLTFRNENENLKQQLIEIRKGNEKEEHFKTEKLDYRDLNNFYTAEDLARYRQKMAKVDAASHRHAKHQQQIRYRCSCSI
jgi:hypothetical protein